MKIATWYNNRDIRIEDVPTPEPGAGEMLVKVMACGICGSDVVEWYRMPRAPLVQGHEIGAEVAAVGPGVEDYRPGDRVFVAPKIPCMACDYCKNENYPACPNVKERLPGGFAEYVLVPAALVERGTYRLSENVTHDQSTFIEPLACAVRAQRLAGVKPGQRVLVLGCGMSGLLHVKLAVDRGCRVTATDVNGARLELARSLGAQVPIDGAYDVVLLCTSALSAIEQAWNSVDKGGAVVFFAVPGPEKQVTIPINALWTSEVRVLTSYYCGPPDITEAMELIESGAIRVDDLITHTLPLDEVARGFQLVLDGKESIKVIIHPHDSDSN